MTIIFSSTKMFYCILSCHPFCSQLAKSWPRSWCRTGRFQCQGIPDGRTCQVDRTLPCGRAFAWEWCRHLLLELYVYVYIHALYLQITTSTTIYMQIPCMWVYVRIFFVFVNMSLRPCICLGMVPSSPAGTSGNTIRYCQIWAYTNFILCFTWDLKVQI